MKDSNLVSRADQMIKNITNKEYVSTKDQYTAGEMMQCVDIIAKCKPIKVGDKYSAKATLQQQDISPTARTLMYLFGTTYRSNILKGTQTSAINARWSGLTPITLYAFKEHYSIGYQEWSMEAEEIPYLTGMLGVALQDDRALGLIDHCLDPSRVLPIAGGNIKDWDSVEAFCMKVCKISGKYGLNYQPLNCLDTEVMGALYPGVPIEEVKKVQDNYNHTNKAIRSMVLQVWAARGGNRVPDANILNPWHWDDTPDILSPEDTREGVNVFGYVPAPSVPFQGIQGATKPKNIFNLKGI